MKIRDFQSIIALTAVASLTPASAAEGDAPAKAGADSIGLMPQQKKAIKVEPNDLNPFAIVEQVEVNETYEDVSLQEQKIRGVFAGLKVSGVTRRDNGYKVLIGGMILGEGQVVPSVIPDQTEQLKVASITEDEMVIAWVEEDDDDPRRSNTRDTGKQLVVPIARGANITPQLPRAVSSLSSDMRRK